jgi:uncharacterized membrane protein (UPF0182 family)
VIAATKDRVVMRKTLREAIEAVLGAAPTVVEPPPEKAPPEKIPPEEVPPEERPVPAGAAEALEAYRDAQQRLKRGDWAGYGEAMERLEEILNQMAPPDEEP